MSEHLSTSEVRRREVMMNNARMALLQAKEITLVMEPGIVCMLIGQLQLALRHPANTGESAAKMREIIMGLIERLPEGARELMMLGFDSRYDA